MSLPATLKQLLAQRSTKVFGSPGLVRLGPVLGTTLNEANLHQAENGWLCLTVSVAFYHWVNAK